MDAHKIASQGLHGLHEESINDVAVLAIWPTASMASAATQTATCTAAASVNRLPEHSPTGQAHPVTKRSKDATASSHPVPTGP